MEADPSPLVKSSKGRDVEIVKYHGIYPWLFMIQIFYNDEYISMLEQSNKYVGLVDLKKKKYTKKNNH